MCGREPPKAYEAWHVGPYWRDCLFPYRTVMSAVCLIDITLNLLTDCCCVVWTGRTTVRDVGKGCELGLDCVGLWPCEFV